MTFDPQPPHTTALNRSGAPSAPLASVSVVVPSYNHAPFVERCLRSIFRQTHKPRELIVIDDGSRDASVRVIEAALEDCPFPCEFIARENRGLCATLNEAFARTAGDYFAYIGSDDVWLDGFLAARVATLDARPAAVLGYGNAYSIDAHDRIVDCTTDWAAYTDGDARRMLLTTLAPLSPTVVYRRRVLERHRWNENSRLEDYEIYLRLSVEGEFAFDPRVLSAWRQHDSNTSRDLHMMIEAKLAAQRSMAESFGVKSRELADAQALASFRGAEELMRAGEKLTAMKLVWQNLRGVPSTVALARIVASLFIPHKFLRRRKESQRRRAHAHYGSLRL